MIAAQSNYPFQTFDQDEHFARLFFVVVEQHSMVDIIDATRYYGIVQHYNAVLGTGTILMSDGREVAVRYSSILGEGVRRLDEGARVSFQIQESRRGPCAVRVTQE